MEGEKQRPARFLPDSAIYFGTGERVKRRNITFLLGSFPELC
jgi:hypothetical protein